MRATSEEELKRASDALPLLARTFVNWKAGKGYPGGKQSVYDYPPADAGALLQLEAQFGGVGQPWPDMTVANS